METLFCYLMIWKSIPSILIYRTLTKKTKEKIDKDIKKYGLNSSLFSVHKLLLKNKIFRKQFFMRVHSESRLKYKLIRWTYRPLESLEISSTTDQVGGGLQVFHGYSTIIFCHSIGENCTVYQNVTIGRGRKIDGIDVPIIGNNVTIYAGAIVLGGIHIGDNVKIGAGAVVVKDIPANTTVVGQPVRVIKHKGEENE